MVYQQWWSAISRRLNAGQGKFAGQRPKFYHCATQRTMLTLTTTKETTTVATVTTAGAAGRQIYHCDESADKLEVHEVIGVH